MTGGITQFLYKKMEDKSIEKKFAIRTKTYIGYQKVLCRMFRDGLRWGGGEMDIMEKEWKEYGNRNCLSVNFGGKLISQKEIDVRLEEAKKEDGVSGVLETLTLIAEVIKAREEEGIAGISKGDLEFYQKDGYKIYSVNDFMSGKVEEYESHLREKKYEEHGDEDY